MAVLFIVSGPFVMDPTGTPPLQMTVHGTIHGLAGGIIFLLMPITCFVYLRRFRMTRDQANGAYPNEMPAYTHALYTRGVVKAMLILSMTE